MRGRVAIVLVLILAAVVGIQADAQSTIRLATMLPFLLLAPGIAWVSLGDRLGVTSYAAVAVSVSVAFTILIGTVLLFVHMWSPELGFWLLVFATAVGLFVTDK